MPAIKEENSLLDLAFRSSLESLEKRLYKIKPKEILNFPPINKFVKNLHN